MQTASNIGGGIFGIFMMWAIHDTFQNPFYTGLAGVMFATPNIASFAIGSFVDSRNKASLIRLACFAQLLAVLSLLLIQYTSTPQAWMYHAIILLFSTSGMIKSPSSTALLPKIAEGKDLIKVNATIRIIGTLTELGIGVMLYMLSFLCLQCFSPFL